MTDENNGNQDQQDGTQAVEVPPKPLVETPTVQPSAPPVEAGTLPNQTSSQITGSDAKKEIKETAEVVEEAMKPFERQLLRLTLGGILVAAVTGAIFYVQLKEMTYQTQILATQNESATAGALLDQMNTRQQLAIAQTQAKAAQDSAKAIQRQTMDSERAWMGIDETGYQLEINKPIVINFSTKNIGKTLAKRMSGKMKVESLGKDESPSFDYSDSQLLLQIGGAAIFPNQPMPSGVTSLHRTSSGGVGPLVYTPELAEKYEHGEIWFAAEGVITYWDIYGRRHWRKFCYRMDYFRTDELTSTPKGADKCAAYNDTDDEPN